MRKLTISTANAEYQIISSLKQNRTKRSKLGELFIEGIESIKQAQRAGLVVTRIITADYRGLSDWGRRFVEENGSAKLFEVSPALYKELCDREEPSEMVVTAQIRTTGLWELALPKKPCVLVFDRPSDHGNFGSLIRSANAFNVDAVLVIGHAIDVYDPKVIRASLGSIFHTNIAAIPSMEELTRWMNVQRTQSGLRLVGTDSTGSVSLKSHRLERPIALVLGNEAKGMSVALKELCDYTVSIPISGAVNSLNVACAGSILLWELYKNA